MVKPVNSGSGTGPAQMNVPPLDPQKGHLRGGVGDDNGGMNPPLEQGIGDLLHDAFKLVMGALRFVYGSLIYCIPVHKARPQNGQIEDFSWFMGKWYPDTVSFYITDSKEVMIQQLKGLSQEKFQVILVAYNKKEGKNLPLDTTAEDFINGLHTNIILEKEDFEGHDDLICPYGLHKETFRKDLERLPEKVKISLREYTDGASLEDFYCTNKGMGLLKDLLLSLK